MLCVVHAFDSLSLKTYIDIAKTFTDKWQKDINIFSIFFIKILEIIQCKNYLPPLVVLKNHNAILPEEQNSAYTSIVSLCRELLLILI